MRKYYLFLILHMLKAPYVLALAVAVLERKGFRREDFARFHPGGALGRKLITRIRDVMERDRLPVLDPSTTLKDAVVWLAERRGIVVAATPDKRVAGVFTAGDLTRLLERTHDIFGMTLESVMTRTAKVAEAEACALKKEWAKVIALLGTWPAPLAIFLRTPEGQMLAPEARALIAKGLGLLGSACVHVGAAAEAEHHVGEQRPHDLLSGSVLLQGGIAARLQIAHERTQDAAGRRLQAPFRGQPRLGIVERDVLGGEDLADAPARGFADALGPQALKNLQSTDPLATLILSVLDGLSVASYIEGEKADAEEAYRLFLYLLRLGVEQLEQMVGTGAQRRAGAVRRHHEHLVDGVGEEVACEGDAPVRPLSYGVERNSPVRPCVSCGVERNSPVRPERRGAKRPGVEGLPRLRRSVTGAAGGSSCRAR